ncbi:MAG: hypothetical protein WD988_01385 [Candidatus Curtissbacteria bacterium]
MNLLVEKIAGTPDAQASCAVFNKKVNLPAGDLGTLVGCILVGGSSAEEMAAVTRDVFELFPKKLEISEEGILETLGSAKQAAGQYLAGRQVETSFAFAFFYRGVCYVVRQGKSVKVLVFDPPKSTELSFEEGSGPARAGQLYLIGTEKFLENFDAKGFLESVDIDYGELVDGLATDITASGGSGEMGAVFVHVNAEEGEGEKVPEVVHVPQEELEPVIESEVNGPIPEETLSAVDTASDSGPKLGFGWLKRFWGGVLRELGRLRRGDLGAVARLRQHVMLMVVLVIVILAISVFVTLWQKNQRVKDLEFSAHFEAASTKYTQGISLLELNRTRARQDFVDAQNEVQAAVALKKNDPEALRLAEDIAAKLKETDALANISFSEVATMAGINSISFAGKNIVGVSGDGLVSVNTSSESADALAGAPGGMSSTVFDNKAFILSGASVLRQDLLGGLPAKITVSAGGQDIGVFFGNIYVLFGSKIAKITPIEGGYAPETNYLTGGGDFLPSSRFAIDGSIWVTRGDKVLKFTRGVAEDFVISGLSGKIGELGPIYTDANLGNLYVIDKTNSALLVISKDGVYKKAYQAPEFGKASDILVSEDESTLYVAVDGKILQASIK